MVGVSHLLSYLNTAATDIADFAYSIDPFEAAFDLEASLSDDINAPDYFGSLNTQHVGSNFFICLPAFNASQEEESTTTSSSRPSVATITHSLDAFSNTIHENRFLLIYQLLEFASKMSMDNNAIQNPCRSYLLPLTHQSQTLLYACGVLAACHYNVRLSNEMFHFESFEIQRPSHEIIARRPFFCGEGEGSSYTGSYFDAYNG